MNAPWKSTILVETTHVGSILPLRMLADPLTKAMSCDRLSSTMMTGRLDLRPTAESLMIKEKNRACRTASKAKDAEAQEISITGILY